MIYEVPRTVKFIETESGMVITTGLEKWKGRSCLKDSFSFAGRKSIGDLFHDDVNILNATELYA